MHFIFYCGIVFGLLQNSIFAEAGKVRFRWNIKVAGIEAPQLFRQYDVVAQNRRTGEVEIIGSFQLFQQLKSRGYQVELIEQQKSQVDERYLRPEEILEIIKQLQEHYPHLVHVKKIGESLKKFPIYAVRLSTFENAEFKPTILFNGMHHAREIMTTEVTTDIMTYLTTNYDNSEMPWVKNWLEHLAIWIIPQLNPDGNHLVWNVDNWWRKNGRGDEDKTWGVDLNRNYPYQWGACNGSSGSKSSQVYRGAEPASEPETQAIMKLVQEQNFTIDISYHSFSEMVVSPYGCQDQYTPENILFLTLGKEFAGKLKTDSGKDTYDYGTGWELLYPVDGEDIGWMYNEQNTLAYVVEINASRQGFQPDYEKWRNSTVERQRPGWQYLLNYVMMGPQLRGRMLDAKTGKPVDGSIRLVGAPYTDEKPRRAKNGVYYKVLIPGSYEFEFSASGYESQTMSLSVDKGPTVWDVYFEPSWF